MYHQLLLVKKNDPELMEKLPDFEGSVSVFHASYLKEIFAERNIFYSKNNPKEVVEEYFLRELTERSEKTNHVQSFQQFVQFCKRIRIKIT